MSKTKLGWNKAKEHAIALLTGESMTRDMQLEVFRKFYSSQKEQDLEIAVALLGEFIKMHEPDFDKDVSLDDIIKYGNHLAGYHPNGFGRFVLHSLLRIRSVPAQWVDRIADEESSGLRVAFVTALAELAKSKTRDLDRILGLASYFLDDPAESVRDILVGVLVKLAELEGERVHYYLVEFEENAGTNRMAAICAVKDKMGW